MTCTVHIGVHMCLLVAISSRSGMCLLLQGYNTNPNTRFVLELHLMYSNGTRIVHGTNANQWTARDVSDAFGLSDLTQTTGGYFEQPQENIDARIFPHDWLHPEFAGGWEAAVAQPLLPLPLVAKTTQALVVDEIRPTAVTQTGRGTYFFDFGHEFMGGIRLAVSAANTAALDGQTAVLHLGESLLASNTVRYPMYTSNRYQSVLTMRGNGTSSFEHHEYSEFRFGSLEFTDPAALAAAGDLSLDIRAWTVRYPWSETDSSFESSNSTLSDVFTLCSDTLKITSLDTYTDSNTRERLPYELDGYIAAKSRYLLQRDLAWPRHSFSYNILYPTWPTEWHQIQSKMCHLDWKMSGQHDLLERYSFNTHGAPHFVAASHQERRCSTKLTNTPRHHRHRHHHQIP